MAFTSDGVLVSARSGLHYFDTQESRSIYNDEAEKKYLLDVAIHAARMFVTEITHERALAAATPALRKKRGTSPQP